MKSGKGESWKKYLIFSLEERFEALSLSSQKQNKFLDKIERIE
jgi:hypothetical protein